MIVAVTAIIAIRVSDVFLATKAMVVGIAPIVLAALIANFAQIV